jgi:HSP20 family molecular chaperone IbpA
MAMSEQHDRKPDDEGFQDIYLEDIVKGVGSLLLMASEFVGALGSGSAPHSDSGSGSGSGARVPLIDIFDEGQELILVIELPGVSDDRVSIGVQDDIFVMEIAGQPPRITEILLPRIVDPATLRHTFRNRILEVRLA